MVSLISSLINSIDQLLTQAAPLPLRRDGTDPRHLIADPSKTRAEAVNWLWEGRLNPPEERFRPDPVQDPPDGPQRRFVFDVTPEEFVETREEFKKRYFASGPGITLEPQLKEISWLSDEMRQAVIKMEKEGVLRRARLPQVVLFSGQAPWGNVVLWIGPYDFPNYKVLEFYQYLPEDEQFYIDLMQSSQRGHLLHYAYTTWNRDMHYFVEEKLMRPSLARDELLRIYTNIFRKLLETIAEIINAAGAQAVANSTLKNSGEGVAEEVLTSYRAQRRAFGLAARHDLPTQIIWRGTTVSGIRGGSTGVIHDLGPGTYFTNSADVAAQYAGIRGTVDDPAIILTANVAGEQLGRVLDLVNGPNAKRWNELVDQAGGGSLVNERYFNLFTGFLNEIGVNLEQIDTIIAKEYVRGGIQINIKNSNLLDKILLIADEIWRAG